MESKRIYTRPYVGVSHGNGTRTVFRSATTPTPACGFAYVIGPFRTRAAADYMVSNPVCSSVAAAERIARRGQS